MEKCSCKSVLAIGNICGNCGERVKTNKEPEIIIVDNASSTLTRFVKSNPKRDYATIMSSFLCKNWGLTEHFRVGVDIKMELCLDERYSVYPLVSESVSTFEGIGVTTSYDNRKGLIAVMKDGEEVDLIN